jgi:hypothetical protein
MESCYALVRTISTEALIDRLVSKRYFAGSRTPDGADVDGKH